jgi:hypothetical protein
VRERGPGIRHLACRRSGVGIVDVRTSSSTPQAIDSGKRHHRVPSGQNIINILWVAPMPMFVQHPVRIVTAVLLAVQHRSAYGALKPIDAPANPFFPVYCEDWPFRVIGVITAGLHIAEGRFRFRGGVCGCQLGNCGTYDYSSARDGRVVSMHCSRQMQAIPKSQSMSKRPLSVL